MQKKQSTRKIQWSWLLPIFIIAIIIGGTMTGQKKVSETERQRFHDACKHWVSHPANYQICLLEKQEASLKKDHHHPNELLNGDNEK